MWFFKIAFPAKAGAHHSTVWAPLSGSRLFAGTAWMVTQCLSRRSPSFGEEAEQAFARGRADAALGNECGDEPRRGHIEGEIRRRAALWGEPHLDPLSGFGPAGDVGDLARVARFDRDRRAVLDLPVDRRRRQRDIERYAIVVRCQRLQIGADLVGDIAARGRAVGAGDAQ